MMVIVVRTQADDNWMVLALSPPWLGKQQHAWAVHHSLPRIKGLLPWTIHPQPLQLSLLLLPLLHLVST